MKSSLLEKELQAAKERLGCAVAALASEHKGGEMEEFLSARGAVFSLERQLADAQGQEYAETIDFPVKWDIGAPLPHLLANGSRTLLLFYLKDDDSEGNRTESIALVQFHKCVSVKLGDPNDEVFHGHPLYGKGLEPYTAQIVQNSKWIEELEAINKVHSQYDPALWRSMNHYVFWFHDETFECVARAYEVEIFQKSDPEKSMDEVILEAVKRLRA